MTIRRMCVCTREITCAYSGKKANLTKTPRYGFVCVNVVKKHRSMLLPSLHNLSIGALCIGDLPNDVTLVIFKKMIADGLKWDQLLVLRNVHPSFFSSSSTFFDYCKGQNPGADFNTQKKHVEFCCNLLCTNEVLREVVALHLRTYMTSSKLMVSFDTNSNFVTRVLEVARCTWLQPTVCEMVFKHAFFGVHDSSKVVPNNEFASCKWLDVSVLPESIEEIGESAFTDCDELHLKSLPPKLKIVNEKAFQWCSGLVIHELPSTVTKLGKMTFSLCTSITQMTLPDSLFVIPEGCFYYCATLEKVRLPNKLTTIEDAAFCGCINLVTIENGLPESLKYIGESAFERCPVLELTVFTKKVELGKDAFLGCDRVYLD